MTIASSSLNYSLTTNSRPQMTYKWKAVDFSLDELVKKLSTHVVSDQKDGPCFIPGKMVGNQRKATAIENIGVVVYDIDGGQSYDEVKQILDETGLAYVMYTSYSHLKTETLIAAAVLEAWAVKNGYEKSPKLHLEPNCVERYLKSIGRLEFIGEFTVDDQLRQTAEGVQIVTRHEEIEKFRACLFLSEPFRLMDHGYTPKDQQAVWETFYFGFGRKLGLKLDLSCKDVARLFYFPSHPPGAAKRADVVFNGRKFLNYRDYEALWVAPKSDDAPASEEVTPKSKSQKENRAPGGAKVNVDARLKAFRKKFGRTFDMPELLRQRAPDRVFGEREKGGVFLECPFEAEHSAPSSQRTWVDGPTEDYPFGIFCTGNACADRKDALIYIQQMIDDSWFAIEELFDPAFGGGPLDALSVKDRLQGNAAFAVAALLKLHEHGQSEQERSGGMTIESNGQGFNSHDGAKLSAIAKKYYDGEALTAGDRACATSRMPKYHNQVSAMLDEVEKLTVEVTQRLASEKEARKSTAEDLPDGYFRKDGYIMTETGKDDGMRDVIVCRDFKVLATTLTLDEEEKHGIGIGFGDWRGKYREVYFDRGELVGRSEAWLVRLANAGLEIENTQCLTYLMRGLKTSAEAFLATKCGWHEIDGTRAFVMPKRAIGLTTVSLSGDGPEWAESGSLQGWKDEIARFAIGNSRLQFAIAAAFAGPLLRVLGAESGACHFFGASSEGKSTLLKCGTSVWGPKVINMNTTKVGVEAILVRHNDTFAPFDELGQMEHGAGELAYMLGNESGKARGKIDGELRAVKKFKTFALMTGEQKLSDKIEGEGKKATAGQEVRVLSIAANAGAGHGCFEVLHGEKNGAALSDRLIASTGKYFGTAGPAFVEFLLPNYATVSGLGPMLDELTKKMVRDDADGQVSRAAKRCAIVGVAGELARMAGILPWPQGAARKAAVRVFNDWLEARGGVGKSEALLGKERIIKYMRVYAARFAPPSDYVTPRSGFIDGTASGKTVNGRRIFYWIPAVFRTECDSCAPEEVARALWADGCLIRGEEGRLTKKKRFDGFGSSRYYAIVLPDEDPEDELTDEEIIARLDSSIREAEAANDDIGPD